MPTPAVMKSKLTGKTNWQQAPAVELVQPLPGQAPTRHGTAMSMSTCRGFLKMAAKIGYKAAWVTAVPDEARADQPAIRRMNGSRYGLLPETLRP